MAQGDSSCKRFGAGLPASMTGSDTICSEEGKWSGENHLPFPKGGQLLLNLMRNDHRVVITEPADSFMLWDNSGFSDRIHRGLIRILLTKTHVPYKGYF